MFSRTVKSDDRGRVKFEGIVPGLSYRILEVVPSVLRRPIGFPPPPAGQPRSYDEVLVLAPEEKR